MRLSAGLQRRVAGIVGCVLLGWLLVTVGMLVWQTTAAWKQRDVAARAIAVQQAEARVAAEGSRIDGAIESLDQRQDYVDAVIRDHLGVNAATAPTPAGPAAGTPVIGVRSGAPTPARSLSGDAQAEQPRSRISLLQTMRARQERAAAVLTTAISARSARAEAALRMVGISPAATTANQGGPFVPYPGRTVAVPRDQLFLRLASAVRRMEMLEQLVMSIPSALPTAGMDLSSGFGYRHDPFTGAGAMHSGLDFKGAHGSPIRAAAAGRISFVGWHGGYGNMVEVDHGHGIITRYAHMSRTTAMVGQRVTPGQQVGAMGSTGRSTGTHLHFEVRVGGVAVNPARFLEANPDVLEVQAIAGGRNRPRGTAR